MEAYYKDVENVGKEVVLWFKIDGEIFFIIFRHNKPGFYPYRRQKIMGNRLLQRIIKKSNHISLYKKYLSDYDIESIPGQLVNISENKKLLDSILILEKELQRDKYNRCKRNGEPSYWKHKLIMELYKTIWK
jgi:hypothetical protein